MEKVVLDVENERAFVYVNMGYGRGIEAIPVSEYKEEDEE